MASSEPAPTWTAALMRTSCSVSPSGTPGMADAIVGATSSAAETLPAGLRRAS